ncbi:HlyD family secretion protein [Marinibaculum pumilum]|uniref:HlyD family secretion protein n=1 Tax=Marinibaculum pumilum TaxID=1766165 RepID=A0ABV7KXT3_9PROT
MTTGGPDAPAGPARQRRRGRAVRLAVVAVLLAAGAWFGWSWLHDRWTHVYVVDARIDASAVTLSSRIAGWIAEMPVDDGDRVRKGDVLAVIDQREARLKLLEIEAQAARIEAEEGRLAAERRMADRQTESEVAEAEARLIAAEADHKVAQAALKLAQNAHRRTRELHAKSVSSAARMDEARTAAELAAQEERSTHADIASARAELAAAQAARERLLVLDRELAVLQARRQELQAQREMVQLDVEDRVLRAAFDGVVDRTYMTPGEYVAPGMRLLRYHDPSRVWVDLNVKETEIRRFRVGSPARVTVDAYPDRSFEGRVSLIGHAATSEFALLPTPNPSGNFTKITQRLPVRIDLQQDGDLLRPGMMVEAVIEADGAAGDAAAGTARPSGD